MRDRREWLENLPLLDRELEALIARDEEGVSHDEERSTLGNVFSTPRSTLPRDLARLGRLAVLIIAAARVSRFFTTDKAGEWWVVGPAKRWAWKHERPEKMTVEELNADPTDKLNRVNGEPVVTPLARWGWRSKAVSIFDCGYCMTPWLIGSFLIAEAATSRHVPVLNKLGPAWRWLTLTLAGAYVAGHTWNRLDNQ